VAAILGVVLLDQPITLGIVAGGILVVAAVYVGAIRTPRVTGMLPSTET